MQPAGVGNMTSPAAYLYPLILADLADSALSP